MSKEMEKLFRDLHKFLDARGGKNLSEAEMEQLVSQFMEDYNASVRTGEPSTPEEPETAYDYLELAAEAKTKKQRVEYTNKALELEPDNLDACLAKIALTAKHPHEMLDELEKLLKKGDAQMEKEGFFRGQVLKKTRKIYPAFRGCETMVSSASPRGLGVSPYYGTCWEVAP